MFAAFAEALLPVYADLVCKILKRRLTAVMLELSSVELSAATQLACVFVATGPLDVAEGTSLSATPGDLVHFFSWRVCLGLFLCFSHRVVP